MCLYPNMSSETGQWTQAQPKKIFIYTSYMVECHTQNHKGI